MTHNINTVANTSISISTYGTGGDLASPSLCTILRNTKLDIGMGLRGYVTEQSCMNVSDVCADAVIWNLQQNYFAHMLCFLRRILSNTPPRAIYTNHEKPTLGPTSRAPISASSLQPAPPKDPQSTKGNI